MKYLIILAPLLFSFKPLPDQYRGFTKKELAQKIDTLRRSQSSIYKKPRFYQVDSIKTSQLQKELKRLKSINNFSPSFDNQFGTIATFERFKGVIDGNIISSGRPVTFKVDFKSSIKIPDGSYLSCTGTNLSNKYDYRIIANCDYLITPEKEYPVIVGLKDLKKIDGISPDHVYTGDEEAILGEGFSAIAGALINARKERVQTSVGFSVTPNIKNTYLNGLLSAAQAANQKSKSHSSQKVIVLAVKDRKEVIIEFKRKFSYEDI